MQSQKLHCKLLDTLLRVIVGKRSNCINRLHISIILLIANNLKVLSLCNILLCNHVTSTPQSLPSKGQQTLWKHTFLQIGKKTTYKTQYTVCAPHANLDELLVILNVLCITVTACMHAVSISQ